MAINDLGNRFPDLRPMGSPPALFTLNGIGTMLYGARDRDAQTGTYVTTLCLTVLFVPVFCLTSYRVANAPSGGWYFLGKQRLSMFAKIWNMLVLSSIVGVFASITATVYFSSPEYADGRKLARADKLVDEGALPEAASLYQQIAAGGSSHRSAALGRLGDIVDHRLADAPLEHAPPVLTIAADLLLVGNWNSTSQELLKDGLDLARRHAEQDPLAAMNTLDAVRSLDAGNAEVAALARELLERIVAVHPDNVQHVVALCEALETEGELDRCRKLLEPLQQQLGETEGARILGQMLAHDGQLDAAHALLVPYTTGRLQRLHDAETQLQEAFERAQAQALNRLREGDGPPSFYTAYDAAGEEEQQRLVDEHLMNALKNDAGVEAARERVVAEAKIVPTALDLGIVLLRRAQGESSPEARQKELEQAEKTFLAIRGIAGESDEYRMFLGQVYYWLGKHDEGKTLFDELLAANDRSSTMLAAVGAILREVGETAEARACVEEAYENTSDQAEKYQAAHQRALLWQDLDDEIKWLQRSDPEDLSVKGSLATSLGQRAQRAGDKAQAEAHFRESIAAYEKLPETASTLNNSAMSYLALYQASGDSAALGEAQRRIDKAVSLSPSDSILLFNAGTMLLQAAVDDVVADKLDVPALKGMTSLALLPYLYHDAQQRQDYQQRVRQHEAMQKAHEYLTKLLVLSPKQPRIYQVLQSIYELTDEEDALAQLIERIDAAQPDVSDAIKETNEFYAGIEPEKKLRQAREAVAAMREIAASRAAQRDLTYAVATNLTGEVELRLSSMGESVDVDKIVAAAEEAHKIAPSSATQHALLHALLFRADRSLHADADYADLYDRTRRTAGAGERIALALAQEDMRAAVVANADFQQAFSLLKDNVTRFPQDGSAWQWAMLRHVDATAAAEDAQRLADDKVAALSRQIDLRLNPASLQPVLTQYWAELAAGNASAADELLRAARQRGVPVPIEP